MRFRNLLIQIFQFIIGITILIYSINFLIKKEKQFLKLYDAQYEIENNIFPLNSKFNPLELSNKAIATNITGFLYSNKNIIDSDFNIKEKELILKRSIEFFGWHEDNDFISVLNRKHSKQQINLEKIAQENRHKPYYYSLQWGKDINDSTNFKYKNKYKNLDKSTLKYDPIFSNKIIYAKDVYVGNFSIHPQILSKITNYKPLQMTKYITDYKGMNSYNCQCIKNICKAFSTIKVPTTDLLFSMIQKLQKKSVKLLNYQFNQNDWLCESKLPYKIYLNHIYPLSVDPKQPKVGDIRLSYSIVPTNLSGSIIGNVSKNNPIISPYKTKNNNKIGFFIPKSKKIDVFLEDYYDISESKIWLTRFVSLCIIFIACIILFVPIIYLLNITRFLRKLSNTISFVSILLISNIIVITTLANVWFENWQIIGYTLFTISTIISLILIIYKVIYYKSSKIIMPQIPQEQKNNKYPSVLGYSNFSPNKTKNAGYRSINSFNSDDIVKD